MSKPNRRLIKAYLLMLLEEQMKEPCKRASGTPRAFFDTQQEAIAFAADPANAAYHDDVVCSAGDVASSISRIRCG